MTARDKRPAGQDTARQDQVSEAVSNAYWRMRQAAVEIAKAGGAEIRERPLFPDSISIYQYAEPLAGIRASERLAGSAARIRREYAEAARGEGIGWQQIGQALGLDQGDDAKTGYDLAVAAFEFFAGRPDLWREADFHYRCASCQEDIADHGPYESHPEDNERGHADDCARLAAEVAAWQARQAEGWGQRWPARRTVHPARTGRPTPVRLSPLSWPRPGPSTTSPAGWRVCWPRWPASWAAATR